MLRKHWMLCVYAVLLMTGEPCSFFERRPPFPSTLTQSVRFQFPLPWITGKYHIFTPPCCSDFLTLRNLPTFLQKDLYPTYLTTSKGISIDDATIATIIGNCVCPSHCTLFHSFLIAILGILGCYSVSLWSSGVLLFLLRLMRMDF